MALSILFILNTTNTNALPNLTSISTQPTTAYPTDIITISSVSSEILTDGAGGNEDPGTAGSCAKTSYLCQSFIARKTGTLYRIGISFGGSGSSMNYANAKVYEFLTSTTPGRVLSGSPTNTTGASTCPAALTYFTDWNASLQLQAGVNYFVCFANTGGSADYTQPCSTAYADGNFLYCSTSLSNFNGSLSYHLPMRVEVFTYNPIKLVIIAPDGNYNSNTITEGAYADYNATAAFSLDESGYIKAKVLNSAGTSSATEIQQFITILQSREGSTEKRTGLMIVANETDSGAVTAGNNYSSFLHNYTSFSAGETGSNPGKIVIDGTITNTCNYDWNCMHNFSSGTHSYYFYAPIGQYKYSGTFSVDANTEFVRIYAPITYNIFKLWENSQEETELTCSNIYSLTSGGDVSNNKRISTSLYLNNAWQYWNSTSVIPQNCYSDISIPTLYPYALPGFKDTTEPLTIMYSGINGLDGAANGELYGHHLLTGDITGARNKNGYTNFYSLHADGEYFQGSGRYFSGTVSRKEASYEDGYYSPITSIIQPNMNNQSAIYSNDVNYNTGDFGLFDTVTCEAELQSHGEVIYDVNFLLLTDYNAIYEQYSFSPYRKFNSSMAETQSWDGAFNIVWHSFKAVNPGHSAPVNCAIQTTNELGIKSGWAISPSRKVYSNNYSTAGGIRIDVKDEDGTIAALGRYSSPYTGDINKIDYYNFKYPPYRWTFDTSSNPFSLIEGDNVLAYTNDTNLLKTAAKTFNVDRGDSFSISLYLPDRDASNQKTVIKSFTAREQSLYTRVLCKAEFYDKDLDWNSATVKFWTSSEGNYGNPTCIKTVTTAKTTNCSTRGMDVSNYCYAHAASSALLNECGSANDCFIEEWFSKRDCTTVTGGGTATGYCSILLTDMNGNETLAQASATITVPKYFIWAACKTYALVDGIEEGVVFTEYEKGYAECEVGVDGMLEPDANFSVMLGGEIPLAFNTTNYDEYRGIKTHVFKAEITDFLASYAKDRSIDKENWGGTIDVFITHPVYGSYATTTEAAVTFTGKRFNPNIQYTEQDVGKLWDWIEGLAIGVMTNPVDTIKDNFFTFLLIMLLIIIFAPLLLYAAMIEARKGR